MGCLGSKICYLPEIWYLSSKKKNPSLLYSYVTYLYLINYTYSPYIFPQNA